MENVGIKKIIVAITGASGACFGIKALEILNQANSKKIQFETHLILSDPAKITIKTETDYDVANVIEMADYTYSNKNIAAVCASGTFKSDGMIIAPCSMKTMGEIANSVCTNLISRTAEVTLKERRRLVLIARESPLTLAQIENMEKITLMQGIICPPSPAFYMRPKNIDDMVEQITARALEALAIDIDCVKRWTGK